MSITLTKISETNTTITLGWTPVPGARGYRFSSEKAAKATWTWDPNRSEVKFAKGSAWYKVEALDVLDEGVYPPVVEPIALVDSSIKAGQTLTGMVEWSVQTSGPVAAVEFWANDFKWSIDSSPPSPFTFSLDTKSLPEGSNALGLALVGQDGTRITPQIGQVTVDNTVEPPDPPVGTPLWNADLSTGDRSQYGDWEYGGTFDGTPPLSERVTVAHSIDGYDAPIPGGYVMRVICAPGDQFGGSSGWRTITRLPPEYTNGGKIVLRSRGFDSSHTYFVLVPPGYPGDANQWLTGLEYHQTKSVPNVAPTHFNIFSGHMKVDVAGVVNGQRYEYVNEQFLQGYEHGKWYAITTRIKHDLYPDGHFELWVGKVGTDTSMQRVIYAPGIASIYPDDFNYELFGIYRANSGSSNQIAYFGGKREYANLADALAWANQILTGG